MKNKFDSSYIAEPHNVGEIISERLESREMKQSELGDLTGIPRPVLTEIIKGRRGITAEMAVLIESALGLSADMLMSVQCRTELDKAYNDGKVMNQIRCMSEWERMSEYLSIPVLKKLDLYKSDVKDKVNAVMEMFHVRDIDSFLRLANQEESQIHFKKSEKLNVDKSALFTWKYYCIDVASRTPIYEPFKADGIDDLNSEVKSILTENKDTYTRVRLAFLRYGIRLLYISKEGQVPVDGMSFWFDDNPTVVITRRLASIDNFAFSLFHELGHVKKHLKRDFSTLVNLDGKELDSMEAEANEYARNSFIPQKEWDRFLESVRNYSPYAVYVPISIEAEKYNVNPQILYGRYMHDTGLYRLRRVFATEVR